MREELKNLLLEISFFRNLRRRDFYFKKLDNLKEKDVQEMVRILKDILKKRDKKVLKVKEEWNGFIAKEEKKILDLIENKTEEKRKKRNRTD